MDGQRADLLDRLQFSPHFLFQNVKDTDYTDFAKWSDWNNNIWTIWHGRFFSHWFSDTRRILCKYCVSISRSWMLHKAYLSLFRSQASCSHHELLFTICWEVEGNIQTMETIVLCSDTQICSQKDKMETKLSNTAAKCLMLGQKWEIILYICDKLHGISITSMLQ